MNYIPYARQCIEDDDVSAVVAALKSSHLTTGSRVAEFETAFARQVGAKYAVAVSNGTAALHIACTAAGISQGDEVITTPLTFAASANCVIYCGGVPVFADIDRESMLIDCEDVKRKVSNKTKAIIPVHYGGELCDMDMISDLANEYGLTVIQDSAHSLGGLICGKSQGSYSDFQTWSFHPVKTITTGEGGAVTVNDEGLYKALLRLRTHGITRDESQFRNADEGRWYYEMLELGYNYRITDFQCALGLSQLKKLDRFAKRRAEIVKTYDEAFKKSGLEIQTSPDWSQPVRHLYTVRVKDKSLRREIFDSLAGKNIGVNVHYIPVYLLPYYRDLGYKSGLCPVAEDSCSRLITLPLFPDLTDSQVEYVIKAVKESI
ncbi:MAG: UDP-4-amino-4,6-dideoxy-N-acetyl-beta-L-altrosamine transaminase [Oscillospiraceae bacterium]|nr:UDP-4-amino-4,6-dideoxy-N-acetyl-beta-L-altrosamine transaminase [Oscillospiraceae bacterium]